MKKFAFTKAKLNKNITKLTFIKPNLNLVLNTSRYSQGKTGVSLNSVQEWLVGCFDLFLMFTQSIKFGSIHSIISADV